MKLNDFINIIEDDTIKVNGIECFRIEATEDICYNVKKGDLGGFVDRNTKITGRSWIYEDSIVINSVLESSYIENRVIIKNSKIVKTRVTTKDTVDPSEKVLVSIKDSEIIKTNFFSDEKLKINNSSIGCLEEVVACIGRQRHFYTGNLSSKPDDKFTIYEVQGYDHGTRELAVNYRGKTYSPHWEFMNVMAEEGALRYHKAKLLLEVSLMH